MALYTYSPIDVSVNLYGIHIITGYADGTFINIKKDTKPFETQVAMDGARERLYHLDEGYTLELTLAQSSVSNNVLSTIYNIDTVTRKGKFPLMIRDGSGTTMFFSATSWIEEIPEVKFSSNMETRTWKFGCSEAALAIGGNGSLSAIEDALFLGAAALPALAQFGLLGG